MNDLIDLSPEKRRRQHSPEFKAALIEACAQPGISVAAVALRHHVNANLLRRWIAAQALSSQPKPVAPSASFVPLPLPLPCPSSLAEAPQDILIELRRGDSAAMVRWPSSAATDCAAFLQGWLR